MSPIKNSELFPDSINMNQGIQIVLNIIKPYNGLIEFKLKFRSKILKHINNNEIMVKVIGPFIKKEKPNKSHAKYIFLDEKYLSSFW